MLILCFRGTVFKGPCGTAGHAINIVGYGTTSTGTNYWVYSKSACIETILLLLNQIYIYVSDCTQQLGRYMGRFWLCNYIWHQHSV